jgi:hypothetical protein
LFSIADIEKHLGYGHHGWVQFRDKRNTVMIKKKNFSDAKTILDALESKLKPRKQNPRRKTNDEFSSEFSYYLGLQIREESNCQIISFKEAKALLKTSLSNQTITRETSTIDKKAPTAETDLIQNKSEVLSNEAISGDGSVLTDTQDPFSSNFSWSFAFDYAKEITRYGEVSAEEEELTCSIVESKKRLEMLQMEALELQSNIKEKEEQSKRNRLLLQDFRLSLQSNPLLKSLIETHNSSNAVSIDELNEKIDRLEKENQSLKDKAGEGENFRTAERFPDKKRFFLYDNTKTNQAIGTALSKMAKAKGITITKIWNGSRDVGNYPIYLHNVLTEWIEDKTNNVFTAVLQEHLRPEYKAEA